MKQPTYINKYTRSGAANDAAGEERLMRFFENLNELEWRQLIEDLILESPNAFKVFLPPRGEDLFSYAAGFLERLNLPTQKLVGSALERVIGIAVVEGNHQMVEGALFIAAILPQGIVAPCLMRLVHQSGISEDIREHAADALANHAGEVPISFWENIDLNNYPNLAPAVVCALTEISPSIAIQRLLSISSIGDAVSLEYPVRVAIRRLVATENQLGHLSKIYRVAPDWMAALLDTVIEFSEFSSIRRLWNPPAREYPQIESLPSLDLTGDSSNTSSSKEIPSTTTTQAGPKPYIPHFNPLQIHSPISIVPPDILSSNLVDDPSPPSFEDVLDRLRIWFGELRAGFEDPAERRKAWMQFRKIVTEQLWAASEPLAEERDKYRQQLADQFDRAIRRIKPTDDHRLLPEHLQAIALSLERLSSNKVDADDVHQCKRAWQSARIETLPSFGEILRKWKKPYGEKDGTAEQEEKD